MSATFCIVMFIKIEESARLYSALGDQVARKSIDHFFLKIRRMIDLHEGKVVKTVGDGLMCRFASVDDAVKAATLIQASSESVDQAGHPGFRLRIGAHQGDVIEEDGDIFGDTVNVAARMQDVARSGQTIISSDMTNMLSFEIRNRVRQIDLTRVKGKKEEMALYEVLWEREEEVTKQVPNLLSLDKIKSRLTLTRGENQYVMTEQLGPAHIGRDATCQFVVNTNLASREHAVIEIRRHKFVLRDQSSNGTYVKTQNGQEVFIRREELVLHGEGFLSLGRSIEKSTDADLIHFKCSLSLEP